LLMRFGSRPNEFYGITHPVERLCVEHKNECADLD